MIKNIVRHYYDFFDKKLENGILIVVIIAVLILGISYVTNISTDTTTEQKTQKLEETTYKQK